MPVPRLEIPVIESPQLDRHVEGFALIARLAVAGHAQQHVTSQGFWEGEAPPSREIGSSGASPSNLADRLLFRIERRALGIARRARPVHENDGRIIVSTIQTAPSPIGDLGEESPATEPKALEPPAPPNAPPTRPLAAGSARSGSAGCEDEDHDRNQRGTQPQTAKSTAKVLSCGEMSSLSAPRQPKELTVIIEEAAPSRIDDFACSTTPTWSRSVRADNRQELIGIKAGGLRLARRPRRFVQAAWLRSPV